MGTPTVWLVRAGYGAEHIGAFIAGGFVSVGWAGIHGLDDLREHDEDSIDALLRASDATQPGADLRELLDFRSGIGVGDVVVSPDTPARDLLFGDVVSDYEFSPTPAVGDHRHVRRVRWLGRWSRDLVEDSFDRTTRHYQRTVLRLPHQEAWLQLAERLRQGDGGSVELPARRQRRTSRAREVVAVPASRVCPACGLTKQASMFDSGEDFCRDCA